MDVTSIYFMFHIMVRFDDSAIYSCTNNNSFVVVTFQLPQNQPDDYIFSRALTPAGTIKSAIVGASSVIFNVTIISLTFIEVKLTVLQPHMLIGTNVSCNGPAQTIGMESRRSSKLVLIIYSSPQALNICSTFC